MRIAILSSEILKQELPCGAESSISEIVWADTLEALTGQNADVYIDLLFEKDHLPQLKNCLPALVVINSVVDTLSETDPSFVRINAWPTFLSSQIIEASGANGQRRKQADEAFSVFNKKLEWLPDLPGFVTPRIISMIINEAFLALHEGVSTEEEIDTAMKMGTNYPYGPFEWAKKIGTGNVAGLLNRLQQQNDRYTSFLPV